MSCFDRLCWLTLDRTIPERFTETGWRIEKPGHAKGIQSTTEDSLKRGSDTPRLIGPVNI